MSFEDGDDPGQCNWFFDDGEESFAEYLPHEFSGDGRTCINCGAPEPHVSGNDEAPGTTDPGASTDASFHGGEPHDTTTTKG